jgi:hypothetical protein
MQLLSTHPPQLLTPGKEEPDDLSRQAELLPRVYHTRG